ncbi:MAG: serine/threonine-protein kinase [Polyangia bacterium]
MATERRGRDLKPANLLLRKDGLVKLADFGLAVTRGPQGERASSGVIGISGTPSYMSPEQATNPAQIDFRSDIYSLGATLYHAAVGHPPLERSTVMETIQAQIQEMPVPVHEKEPAFNRELSLVLQRMLAKQREDRFESWEEVKVALAAAQSAESVSAVRLSSVLPVEPGQPPRSSPPHARETLPLPEREAPLSTPLSTPAATPSSTPSSTPLSTPAATPAAAPVQSAPLAPVQSVVPVLEQPAVAVQARLRRALAHPDATMVGLIFGAGLLVILALLLLLL